jgi:transmembrane sensor
VYLDGEASFEVVTEAAKPFEVYSGALATIVLGTSFTVNDFEQSPYIRVTLHTGKVLVRSPSHEVCLLPDQELWYNKSSMLATVRNLHRREGPTDKSMDGKMVRMPDWYMFNNQSLAQVLDQLSSLYEVRIHYSATDLRGLYFIGRFDRTDSLDDILQDIALLNGLTVRRDSSQYFVKKKIH